MAVRTSSHTVRLEIYDIIRIFRAELDRRSTKIPLSEKVALSGIVDAMRIVVRHRSGLHRFTIEEVDHLECEAAKLVATVTRSTGAERPIEKSVLEEDGRTIVGHEFHSWLSLSEKLKGILSSIPDELVEPKEEKFDFTQGDLPLLSEVVPAQKVSPVHFDIKDDKLVLAHISAVSRQEDNQNIHNAHSTIVESGKKIIEDLRHSNCDRRFLDDVAALQSRLESVNDIVRLGIMNLACEEQRKEFEAELPPSLAGRLRGHFSNIAMYVAQFPEWLRYTENAYEVELSASDIRRSQEIANEISAKFEAIPAKVDPEVPRTLRAISYAASRPGAASKRVAFALVRTLENLCIGVFSRIGQFLDDMASQSLSKSAKVGSVAVAISFGSMILSYATNLAAIYDRVPGMAWLKTAVEIFNRALLSLSF